MAIPEAPNFYSMLRTTLSREQVAGLYGALGWKVRRCSWTDFEVRSPWAELVIAAESPILLHGAVDDVVARADELVAPLRQAGVAFRGECYGPDMELLTEISG
ncbi:MAG TPA: hypothetical protein VE913_23285 [Longimicrobium sp.]|nr:hypothetical protein [Longimicrobium sp.]